MATTSGPASPAPSRASASANALDEARKRLIVALDVPDAAAATELVARLEGTCTWFKVGLELFVSAGPAVLEPLLAQGHSVFLDLKLHDIPNTVAGAVRSAASLGVRMLTCTPWAARPCSPPHAPRSTVSPTRPSFLPSLCSPAWTRPNSPPLASIANPPIRSTSSPAWASLPASADLSARRRRSPLCAELTGPEGVLVIPGIRPAGAEIGDQKRIATPADALRAGASYLVVGRPITQARESRRSSQRHPPRDGHRPLNAPKPGNQPGFRAHTIFK